MRPAYKIYIICIEDLAGPMVRALLSAVCNPLFDSCGRIFGNIRFRGFAAQNAPQEQV